MVAGEAAVLDRPGEGSFHNPTAADGLEALGAGAAFDDLRHGGGLPLGPGHRPSGTAGIGKGVGHAGVVPARGLEPQPRPVPVLKAGGVDLDREQAAIGVGRDDEGRCLSSCGP